MSKRAITSTTIAFGILAAIAVVVAWAGISDYRRFENMIAVSEFDLEGAKLALEKIHYDANGNVIDADRQRYDDAMSTIKVQGDTPRFLAGQETKTYPLIGGGAGAFLLFVILGVRSTKRR